MRFYSVAELAQDISSKLGNGSVNEVADFYGRIDEGRRKMLKRIEPPELVRNAYLEEAIYDQVNKYAIPEDLQYTSVINLRKLSGYRNVDRMSRPLQQVFRRRFDQKRLGSKNVFSINYTNGVKTMSLLRPVGLPECQSKVINPADSLTQGGTWNVGGNVVNLTLDRLKHISGHGALKFDFNASSTSGSLECILTDAVDIYDYFPTGAAFTWLDISSFRIMITVKLILESAAGQTYEMTVNAPHDNNVWQNEWNLLKYQLDSMAAINTPNPRAITKIRFEFTTTGEVMNGCHLDNILVRKGQVYDVDYQSSYIIKDATTGAWKKRATSPNDIVIAEEDTYQILMIESAISVMEEATNATQYTSAHIARLQKELDGDGTDLSKFGAYRLYLQAHPSEQILQQETTWIYGNMYDGLSDAPMFEEYEEYGQDYGNSNGSCGGCGNCWVCNQ